MKFLISLLVAFALSVWAPRPLFAQGSEQEGTLKIIRDAASDLCGKVPPEGKREENKLSGDAGAAIIGLVKKLKDSGANLSVEVKEEKFYNVPQEELAKTLEQTRHCELDVFIKLADILLRPLALSPAISNSISGNWHYEARISGPDRETYKGKCFVTLDQGHVQIRGLRESVITNTRRGERVEQTNEDWRSIIVAVDGQTLLMYYTITEEGVTHEAVAVLNLPSLGSFNEMTGHFFEQSSRRTRNSRFGTITFRKD